MAKTKDKIEAILFMKNEAVSFSYLSKFLETDTVTIKRAIQELVDKYQDGGVRLVVSDKDAQLVALFDDDALSEKLFLHESQKFLSDAQKETLSIVLYLSGSSADVISRARGVQSLQSLKKLIRTGYVNEKSGNYYISSDGLKQFGIEQPELAPQYDEIKKTLMDIVLKNTE